MRITIRHCLVLAAVFCASHLDTRNAAAWNPTEASGACDTTRWRANTGIQIAFTDGDFSGAQRATIRASLEQFNQLPNAKIFFYEGTSSCDPDDPTNDTICFENTVNNNCGACGSAHVLDSLSGSGECTHRKCRVELAGNALSGHGLFRLVAHEVAHCLGLDHSPNGQDWMASSFTASPGGTQDHSSMTRDTLNGLSHLYPFGQSFFFGDFMDADGASILVRDAQPQSDTVPWHLIGNQTFDSPPDWFDAGEVMPDHGNETTLAHLAGDFTGDGCTDMARGLCDSCDPSDGGGDTVDWNVKVSECDGDFDGSEDWRADFGNGEDYDQYRVGDFDGDGCDDIWLIRNASDNDCDGDETDPDDPDACVVEIYWLLARRPNGDSCLESGSRPNNFVQHGPNRFAVSDRSAASGWPWVVGDFETTNGLGCDDVAYGVGLQDDPETLEWHVLRAYDTNSNSLCDKLGATNGGSPWVSDWGNLGFRRFFAANAGNGNAEDLIQVYIPVNSGLKEARWRVIYSDGIDDFSGSHTPASDLLITGSEAHWTGMVFGIGDFNAVNDWVDFITLRGANTSGAVKYQIGYRASGSGNWSLGSTSANTTLPISEAGWDQPTDEDLNNSTRDNAGDDVKDIWWCAECEEWFCDTCGGCCS